MQTVQTTTTTTIASKSMLLAYILWFFLGSLGSSPKCGVNSFLVEAALC